MDKICFVWKFSLQKKEEEKEKEGGGDEEKEEEERICMLQIIPLTIIWFPLT